MKKIFAGLLAATAIAATLASTYAWAHGGRHHHHRHARVGVFIGGPVFASPWWWHTPYPYYPPATVVVRQAPVVYIEQADAAAPVAPAAAPQAQAPQQYWYYCPDSKTYHPYVNTCASPWQRVIPHPPPPG